MNGVDQWAIVCTVVAFVIGGWAVFCRSLARWADELNAQNAIRSRQWQQELMPAECGQGFAHPPHVFADDDAQNVLLRCPGVPR